MPYCDSLVCCYIMKCQICNKSFFFFFLLLCCLCTGGNVIVWCGTGSTCVYWSVWLACFILLLFHLYLFILSYSCCFFVMFVYLRLIWMDRASAHLALPHQNFTSHTCCFHSEFIGRVSLFFCLHERKEGASSLEIKNVFHCAFMSAYTIK